MIIQESPDGEMIYSLVELVRMNPDKGWTVDMLRSWIQRGVKSVRGTRVFLEAEKIGRRYRTSEEALERFERNRNMPARRNCSTPSKAMFDFWRKYNHGYAIENGKFVDLRQRKPK